MNNKIRYKYRNKRAFSTHEVDRTGIAVWDARPGNQCTACKKWLYAGDKYYFADVRPNGAVFERRCQECLETYSTESFVAHSD